MLFVDTEIWEVRNEGRKKRDLSYEDFLKRKQNVLGSSTIAHRTVRVRSSET